MRLADYQVREVIYAYADTVVARAESDRGERVVLKFQSGERPSPDLNARWQHEYSILSSMRSKWVVRAIDLITVDHGLVLVLEDFGSSNLAHWVTQPELDMADRLALAMQLCSALSAVHEQRLIHGDISSKNVLVDLSALRLKLCDFGLSTKLDHDQKAGQEALIRGTLEYISPEQTGRTNLQVDYRSDFYSLGVTLYELFSGRTPFRSDDPMTLLHAQIAIMPTPLHELDRTIPEAISRIVQKLLQKSPDDRYQSSFGLQHDLTLCAQQWHRTRQIDLPVLATADVPERFCISNKLYGREQETLAIRAAFERVCEGQGEVLLIRGYSGIGKTALVAELYRPIVARRGYLARGKCDQYSRNQPYAALIQAFQQLLRQLASEGDQRRDYWRHRLHQALGDTAAAVHELVPELEHLLGAPAPLAPLPPAETENRLHVAFGRFVAALCAPSHPLVLFLDDLQWADASSLKLIEHLARSGDHCVLIVGAYRDNEVDERHSLTLSIDAMVRSGVAVNELKLRDLNVDEVSHWIADTLHASRSDVATLATLCHDKTQGNPFFLTQFLYALEEHGDLHYQRGEGRWQWNVEQIRLRDLTDNVVELMVQKLRSLAAQTQEMLTFAAHLGDQFDMRQLMAVSGIEAAQAADILWPALRAGMIMPMNETYKFVQNQERLKTARYRFLHDRVRQAAYGLIDERARDHLRLRCGRALLAQSSPSELEARLFTILEQLNLASHLLDTQEERQRLLALNIRGGLRAKSASAFPTAVSLLRCARQLLGDQAWVDAPEQTLLLFKELSEAEYLAGNFDAAEALYPIALASANSNQAKLTICLVQVDQYQIQGRFEESFRVLLSAFEVIGRPFPADDAEAGRCFAVEFPEAEAMLAQYDTRQLLAFPEISDPILLLELRLCLGLSHATYQIGRFNSFVLNACRMVKANLAYGHCDLSCIGYVIFVTAMSVMGRPYPDCYGIGKLALDLAESRDNKYFWITIYQYFSAFYQHWCEPLPKTFPLLQRGFDLGQTGINPLSTGYCALLLPTNKFVHGTVLAELEAECERNLRFLQASHLANTENMLQYGIVMPLQALRGKTLEPTSFDSTQCSSSDFFNGDYHTPSIPLALHSAAMVRHAYLLDDGHRWQYAAANLSLVARCLPDSPSWADACFFTALGQLKPEFSQCQEGVEGNHADFQARFASWAGGCAENYQYRHLLLAAEAARSVNDERAAMDLYARAIEGANASESMLGEALCNELYSRFWLAQGQRQLANHFVREAYFHYWRWGAVVKCQALERQWPSIAFRVVEQRHVPTGRTATFRNVSEQTGLVDLQSLLKANYLLAREIQLDSLLQKMLEVLLENAGAEFGAIIIDDEDQLLVEAVGGLGSGRQVEVRRVSKRLQDHLEQGKPQLPNGVIEYVRLTRSVLVLNNPDQDERFAQSAYLRERKPKSVICLPVVAQAKLIALVYLENNLMENAFTTKQQVTLELLSGQVAISLVNARLYESMEQKILQRTEELRQMSLRDGLTGIANRRSFDERLALDWRRCLRSGETISLLMVDIDHFKQFNDLYGHVQGDHCIKTVAQALHSVAARSTDLVARYGGEEFAILMGSCDEAMAKRVAQHCLDTVLRCAIPHQFGVRDQRVSVSIGICTLKPRELMAPEDLVQRADEALYRAKRDGRARHCLFEIASE